MKRKQIRTVVGNIRGHRIDEQTWEVNGRPRTVYVLDEAHAPDGHFQTLEDAKRYATANPRTMATHRNYDELVRQSDQPEPSDSAPAATDGQSVDAAEDNVPGSAERLDDATGRLDKAEDAVRDRGDESDQPEPSDSAPAATDGQSVDAAEDNVPGSAERLDDATGRLDKAEDAVRDRGDALQGWVDATARFGEARLRLTAAHEDRTLGDDKSQAAFDKVVRERDEAEADMEPAYQKALAAYDGDDVALRYAWLEQMGAGTDAASNSDDCDGNGGDQDMGGSEPPDSPDPDPGTRKERLVAGYARTTDVARRLASRANRARIVATPVVARLASRANRARIVATPVVIEKAAQAAALSRQAYAAGQQAHADFRKAHASHMQPKRKRRASGQRQNPRAGMKSGSARAPKVRVEHRGRQNG